MTEMEEQLSRLFNMAAGEPPRRVGVEQVQRQAARSRAAGAGAAIAAILATVGVGVAVAGQVRSPSEPAGPGPRTSAPPFYVVQNAVGSAFQVVIRATATGAVRTRLRCPGNDGGQVQPRWIAFSGSREFFAVCERSVPAGSAPVSAPVSYRQTRLYRFTLSRSGGVSGYTPVPGGALAGLWLGGIAASADGTRVAVTVDGGSADHGAIRSNDVLVIDTRTGRHSVWHSAPRMPGRPYYGVSTLSLTAHGTELAYLAQPQCGKQGYPCSNVSEEIRAIHLTPGGGSLTASRVLLRQSAIMRLSQGYIEDAVITPDGRALTLAIGSSGSGTDTGSVSVVQYLASTGHRLRVVYLRHTGNGFSYSAFAADAAGTHFIIDSGHNGWIDHGRLVPLPVGHLLVLWEAW